mgnify:CR=1 FL=1
MIKISRRGLGTRPTMYAGGSDFHEFTGDPNLTVDPELPIADPRDYQPRSVWPLVIASIGGAIALAAIISGVSGNKR